MLKNNGRLQMRLPTRLVVALLCSALMAYAQGNTFDKVRYNGGTVSTKVKPDDWHNKLTVTPDLISFQLKDGQIIRINPKLVTALSYGQEAHRRVGTMVALAILVAPVALFGLFHKTRLHYIGIEYTAPNGSKGGLLMQGDKSNYRAILVALQSVTGVPVAVAENDRQYVPVGVTTSIASESNGSSEANTKQAPAPNQPNGTGSVSVNSVPSGADVYADGSFVGNAPANLKLAPGSHVIRIVSSGYKDWTRTIKVMNGSSANLTATLDKTQ